MAFSRIALGTAGLAICFFGAGCSVQATIKTQTRFVNAPDTVVEAKADWTNQSIVIEDDGTPVSVNGGLEVIGDASITKVKVTARVIAYADSDDKTSADKSIVDAAKTVVIEESATTIKVKCGHGGSYGSSSGDKSGCESLTVRVPAGSVATPVSVNATAGNGDIKVTGITGSVTSKNNGSGDVSVSVTPTKGAKIAVTGDFSVSVALPSDFAADMITLSGPKVVSTDFPDVSSGKGRGTAGDGATSITLTSTSILDDETVTLKKQ